MNEKYFKKIFVATFLATWVAARYEDCCSAGAHKTLRHPPVEDAEDLAEDAWAEWVEKMRD